MNHSIGSKKVTIAPAYTGVTLESNKAIHVAVHQPIPDDTSDSPEYIAAQIAKQIHSIVAAASSEGVVNNVAQALDNARKVHADYLFLIHVKKWKRGSYLSPGQQAALNITVLDVHTQAILTAGDIHATCLAMLVGLEQSPRECVRPQMDIWLNGLFVNKAKNQPYSDITTFR